MSDINEVIKNKKTNINPIWIMRQAGRYLPEFREIRKLNPNFINLCLNENLSSEITLQPLKRFDLDAAIIFSDILMLPYGLNQKVEFEKGFGPKLGEVNIEEMSKLDEVDFVKKIYPVYKAIKSVSSEMTNLNKNTIGFVGAGRSSLSLRPQILAYLLMNKHVILLVTHTSYMLKTLLE